MHCRCGKIKILAHGMCAVCYTLRRQDEEYFGGLREKVLERDSYRCRVCDASGRDIRSIIVFPGKSLLHLMISLCPACHAKIHRTKVAIRLMPPLLLLLWREVHPNAHEQTALNFNPPRPPVKPATLFPVPGTASRPRRNGGHL
jgi:5-methylcytosine-specific restriction endonuclease McrA